MLLASIYGFLIFHSHSCEVLRFRSCEPCQLIFYDQNTGNLNSNWHILYPCGLQPLELVGQKYLLAGEVHIDSALYGTAHLLDDSLVIQVQSSDGRVVDLDNPARLISEPDDVNSHAVYEYSHWAELGMQLIFSAHHGRCD